MAMAFAARSISISTPITTIFGDEHILLTASASGFIDGETIYIKGAFFQPGSSNYFGYSKKTDNTWVKNGETAIAQQAVVIGAWDNQLVVKSDFADSGYHGEGEYGLKLGYYYVTNNAVPSSVNWSINTVSIAISEPDPTPTHTPTLTATPTQQPAPTALPSPSLFPTSKPTTRPLPTQNIYIPLYEPTVKYTSDILGTDTEATERGSLQHASDTSDIASFSSYQRGSQVLVFALLFVGIGTALLACGLALEKTNV